MIAILANERPLDSTMVRIAHYNPEQISEHIRLLHEARLIDGSTTLGSDRRLRWHELRLTWWGHDFIECARSEAIWRLACEVLGPDCASAGLDVWHKTLIEAAYRVLGYTPNGGDGMSG
jgi:hypothetical protein